MGAPEQKTWAYFAVQFAVWLIPFDALLRNHMCAAKADLTESSQLGSFPA